MIPNDALHVALLAPGEIFGGAERQVLTLLKYLRDEGLRSRLYVFHDRELAQRARDLGTDVEILAAAPLVSWRNVRQIARRCREDGTGVLHIHGYKAAAHVALLAAWRRIPTVKTEHGAVEVKDGSWLQSLKPRLYRAIENRAARWLRAELVYVTEELRRGCAREHRGLSSHVIVNGIDPASLEGVAKPASFAVDTFNVVIVGRLEPVKGVQFAIEALADPNTPAEVVLTIVGDGPERERLQNLARSLNVAGRVRFAGFRRDALAFIAAADTLLMPSLHEGLPYTLLEAMLSRTAVVASAVGGLAEVLTHRRNALLVPVGAVRELAAAMAALREDATLREGLTATAHEDVAARFTMSAMGAAYERLYRRVARRAF